jgi:pimeloyl-ACP methyl ester carboxylesterase
MPGEPFEIAIAEPALRELATRLAQARQAEDFANDDWRYGVDGGYLAELVDHWRDAYDWRAQEGAMNAFANYRTTLDGMPIHYIHQPGKGPNPMPLILTHGWPWTFWDFQKVIGPLSDPASFGADPADAFDVIVPSLPGFAFSTPLRQPGVQWARTADLWVALMRELGYARFAAYGGDWGSLVTAQLGHKYAEQMIGIHLGVCVPLTLFQTGLPTEDQYADDEKERFHHTARRMSSVGTSHLVVQSDDPQTLAYGLNDSPIGLLAWILERRRNWSDSGGQVESRFSKDELITTAMIYWLTQSIGTSMRYYWEAQHFTWTPSHDGTPVVPAPTAITLWPQELMLMPNAMMESFYNLKRLTTMPRGGHFHPMEEPELLVEDIRAFFRTLRD